MIDQLDSVNKLVLSYKYDESILFFLSETISKR